MVTKSKVYKYKIVAGFFLTFAIFVFLASIGGIYAEKINQGQIHIDPNFIFGVFLQIVYSILLIYGSVKYYSGKDYARKLIIKVTSIFLIILLLSDIYFLVKQNMPVAGFFNLFFPFIVYILAIKYKCTIHPSKKKT